MSLSDRMLVRRARNGNKQAFQQLMEQQMVSMYKVARAILKNDDDAADAMQETALTCWMKINELEQDKYFKSWMVRILINHCNAIYRKRMMCISAEVIPEKGICDQELDRMEWKMVLNSLDDKYRIVIILYYVEGFKTKEIADILQMGESAVRVRLSRGREMLRKQLETDKS